MQLKNKQLISTRQLIKGNMMKNSTALIAILLGIGLVACDKTTVDKTPDTVVVPVPIAGPAGATGAPGETGAVGDKGSTGQSGDEGIQGKPGKAGDEGIQGKPGNPGGDTTIIIPPPVANMPPEIVPKPSSATPAN